MACTGSKGSLKRTFLTVVALAVSVPMVYAAEFSRDAAARYILATAKAFRTVYVKQVVEQTKKAGVKPAEKWQDDAHAIMLPAQFVKAAGAELKDFELSLIGLTPIYKSNLPKSKAEEEALQKMMKDPSAQVVTFEDGNQFKGLSADFALVQSCADCHNAHPSSPKKDFKKGDLMGAIVVRFNK
jgi:hypothetical protein